MNQKELQARLRAVREPAPPPGLRDRLEGGIPDILERPERRWSRGSGTMIKVSALTASAAAMLLAAVWIGIGPREPGDKGRARVDKADRTYVFDGKESTFYHPLRGEAYRASGGFGHELFWPAAWVRQIRNGPVDDVEVLAHEEVGGSGRLLIREQGADVLPLEPSFLGDFDRDTEIVWNLETHFVTELRRWVVVDGTRRLFSEVVSIEYLSSIDDGVFELELPDALRWGGVAEASVGLLELGPREVAQRLFEAALRGDRKQVELFCPSPSLVDLLLDGEHRPTEILFIGEPFRSGNSPGVYVPYKVRFGSGWGSVKTHNLALRNDNEQGRWVYDGGI